MDIKRSEEDRALIMESFARSKKTSAPQSESWKVRLARRIVDRPKNPFQKEAEEMAQVWCQEMDASKQRKSDIPKVKKEQLQEARELVEAELEKYFKQRYRLEAMLPLAERNRIMQEREARRKLRKEFGESSSFDDEKNEKAETIRKQEQLKLIAFFEKDIVVPPMPSEMVVRLDELEKLGMEAHYLPAEDMPKDRELKAWKKKPNDRFYDVNVKYNICQSYTKLQEGWFLINARQKPTYANGDQMYANDPFASVLEALNEQGIIKQRDIFKMKRLNPKSRFGLHPDDFEKPKVIAEFAKVIGIRPEQLSLPQIMVWNIVANIHHPEWGATKTAEWLKDKFAFGARFLCGHFDDGGVSNVYWLDDAADTIGFRPLVRFSSP